MRHRGARTSSHGGMKVCPTMMGYGWGMGVGGWVAMAIFWVAVITLIIWLATRAFAGRDDRNNGGPRGLPPTESPEQVLDRLFAMGEIDETTYRTRRTARTEMRNPS